MSKNAVRKVWLRLGSSKWYESSGNEGNAAQGPFGNSTVFGGLVGSDLWYTAEVTALAATSASLFYCCLFRVSSLLSANI